MSDRVLYEYFDGSGNAYSIRQDKINYQPVPREKSSSMAYYGGEPGESKISPDQFSAVETLLINALQLKEIHIQKRVMLSGVIVHYSDTSTIEVILRPGSREIFNIETMLNNLIKKPG